MNWLFTSVSTVWEVLIELVHSTLEELRDWYSSYMLDLSWLNSQEQV